MANFTTTLATKYITPLTDIESSVGGFNVKFTIPYTQINNASATGSADVQTVTLGATPAFWYADKALCNVTSAFAGCTALTMVVGTTSSTTAFVTSTSVLTAGAIPMSVNLPLLINATGTTSVSLVAVLTCASGSSISALTTGSVDIYLSLRDLKATGGGIG